MFDPVKEHKIWGHVIHLFQSPHASISNLSVRAAHRCSLHRHRYRANQFAVTTGCIIVELWGLEGKELESYNVMAPGEVMTVPSEIYHRFRVASSGYVTEVYWSDQPDGIVSYDDIERLDTGGEDDIEDIRRMINEQVPPPAPGGQRTGEG